MTIGDVFTKAWELWRRDVGWLILAGLVVGLIVGIIAVVVFAIVAGMAAVSIGGIAIGSNNSSTSLTGLGVSTLIGALIIGLIGYLIVSVIAFVFYGGLFEMVIGAAREGRGVVFGDLFSGFRKFGTFIVFWLVVVGISVVCGIVMIIPIIGWIAVIVFAAWLGTTWLYVLPLIADRGLTFGEAARASSQMVKGVGWWKTFGTIVVLGVAFLVVSLVISVIGRASSPLSSLLALIFEIAAGPFAICYVSTMYLGFAGEAVLAPAGGYVTPAPPAYGGAPYVTPPAGGQMYQPVAPPPIPWRLRRRQRRRSRRRSLGQRRKLRRRRRLRRRQKSRRPEPDSAGSRARRELRRQDRELPEARYVPDGQDRAAYLGS